MNDADIDRKIINAQDKMIKNLNKQIEHYKSMNKLFDIAKQANDEMTNTLESQALEITYLRNLVACLEKEIDIKLINKEREVVNAKQ